jgi:hypothetical protein
MKTGSSLPHSQQRDTGPYQFLCNSQSNYFFSRGTAAKLGLDVLYDFPRSHSDTQQSVGLLWTNDRAIAETSN